MNEQCYRHSFHQLGCHYQYNQLTFLTYFISLLIVQILEHALNHEYSSEQIITSLRKSNVVELTSTTFKTLYYDRRLQKLKNALDIDFGMNLYTRAAIRKILAATKKKS